MQKKTTALALVSALIMLMGCQSMDMQKVGKVLNEIGKTAGGAPNQGEMQLGLKSALKKGAEVATSSLSVKNGFFSNAAIKILMPTEFHKAEKTLRKIGLGSLCDKAILSFNRAAEKASSKAMPILANAVSQMSFSDVVNILKGSDTAATDYLKRVASKDLFAAFFPVVAQSADSVSATKYWGELATRYNRIPFVKPVTADIKSYITNKALDGLFMGVAKEEKRIRENPIARGTEILKRVFGWADAQKG